ncbi:MAG: cupin domain-containing protein [Pedobacter sp.]|nr:MAG: cupin domain-containing protein [Pedobacter sp.]
MYIETSSLKEITVIEGFHARFIHTHSLTLGFWRVEKGSKLPPHSHVHEQITQVEKGEFEMTINGETRVYSKGKVAVIPSGEIHSGIALTDCELVDIFCPVREDYKAL